VFKKYFSLRLRSEKHEPERSPEGDRTILFHESDFFSGNRRRRRREIIEGQGKRDYNEQRVWCSV